MAVRVGERLEQELGEVPPEELLEPGARRHRLRLRIVLWLDLLGD
jgi:hypothetical protein